MVKESSHPREEKGTPMPMKPLTKYPLAFITALALAALVIFRIPALARLRVNVLGEVTFIGFVSRFAEIWATCWMMILLIVVIIGALQWVKERIDLPVTDLDLVILEVLSETGLELTEARVLYRGVCRRVGKRLSRARVYRRFATLRQRKWVDAWRKTGTPVMLYYVINSKGRHAIQELHEAAVALHDRSPFASFRVALGSQRVSDSYSTGRSPVETPHS